MKKAIFFAAALALTFSSCGNKTQNAAANADSAAVVANEESGAELSADNQTTIDNLTAELQKAIDAKDAKTTISVLANSRPSIRTSLRKASWKRPRHTVRPSRSLSVTMLSR